MTHSRIGPRREQDGASGPVTPGTGAAEPSPAAPIAPAAPATAARRQVRLPAWLRLGLREVPGHTSSVSSHKLYVHLSPDAVQSPLPEPGTRLPFRVQLPDGGALVRGDAEVLWVDPDERDAAGRALVGVGLRVVDVRPEDAARLAEAWRHTRYGILVVEPDEARMSLLQGALGDGYQLHRCLTGEEALSFLAEHPVAMLLAHLRVRDMHPMELVRRAAQLQPTMRLALMMPDGEGALAMLHELVELGRPISYLPEAFRPSELVQVVRRGVEAWAISEDNARLSAGLEQVHERLLRENTYLRQREETVQGFEHIIGQSDQLRRTLAELDPMRRSDAPICLHGETGTGKELVARALHFGGPRAHGPFVAQNCAGLSDSLLESTLFGHRKGAFTGAERDHPGVFQQAHGGTLFLDEVAELSPRIQAALLRVLQDGEVMPLGGTAPVKVDVRIVSATHVDLRQAVQEGRFREDLYFRLVVLAVRLPPLRERVADIPLLAAHFLRLHCQRHGKRMPELTPDWVSALQRHAWPGNVRELENEIERLVVLADEGQPLVALLSPQVRRAAEPGHASASPAPGATGANETGIHIPSGLAYDEAVLRLEKALVARALQRSGGVVSEAARALGVERSRLTKLRDRLGLTVANTGTGTGTGTEGDA